MDVGGHYPSGGTVCIHSVVIRADCRRQGLAAFLVQTYIRQVASSVPSCNRFALLSHADKTGLYHRAGFTSVGVSPVSWGSETWIEMVHDVTTRDRTPTNTHVDAFTVEGKHFSGNPAAVVVWPCPIDVLPSAALPIESGYPPSHWCQSLAAENNLSETAFLVPRSNGEWSLRWWTPGSEVDLCGHATLASAHVLFESSFVPPAQQSTVFNTRSGKLTATRQGTQIQLEFPVEPPAALPATEAAAMLALLPSALGLTDAEVAAAATTVCLARNRHDAYVELPGDLFQKIKPNFSEINKIEARGLVVTCRGSLPAPSAGSAADAEPALGGAAADAAGYHFLSRWFGPRVAVNEDPVTGSAHCGLVAYWEARLHGDDAITKAECSPWLRAHQASGRGGDLWVRRVGQRVLLRGTAETVLQGWLHPTAMPTIA